MLAMMNTLSGLAGDEAGCLCVAGLHCVVFPCGGVPGAYQQDDLHERHTAQ